MYGIPNMKLEKAVVQRRLDLMSAEGIRFVTGIDVGADYGSEQLIKEFDATVLCCGATKPRDLVIEGRSLGGIYFAMDFLGSNTRSLLDSCHQDKSFLSAKDKDVIVIGGGDTGTDCVATALRHGCRSLTQFEILPQPPERRGPDNPWPQWPRIYRLDYGQEEAAAVFGSDPRSYSIMTSRFLSDEGGHVRAVQSVEVELTGESNGPRPVRGTEKEWPAQMVLLALGFQGAETEGLLSQLGVLINDRGNVSVTDNKMTNLPGVFAAGDIERGQSLVVWAIADGRRAAKGVDEYLMGETALP
jgi:glutamate synthase (NADPH/NADH) small chain